MYKIFKLKDINISFPVLIEQPVKDIINRNMEEQLVNKAITKESKIKNIALLKELIERTKKLQDEIQERSTKEVGAILDNARKAAMQLKDESIKKGYDEGFSKGYDEGFSKGYDEGFKKGYDEAQGIIVEAKLIKEEVIKEKERLYKERESDMVNVILEVVEKIIGINMEKDKDIILNLVKKGMENYDAFSKVTVRVCENDYEHCIKNKDKLLKSIEFIDDINILKDLSLERGDCIIETNSGIINSGVYTQLQALKKIFVGVLNE